MAFVNLPANLQDIFGSITDRISKLESGPNQAMYYAESAQGSSTQATAEAAQALAQAQAANALGVQALAEANTAIAQATYSIQTANAAYAQSVQATIEAGAAQTSADGKNTIYYGTASAPGTATVTGASGNGTSVTYNAYNGFVVGQTVTVSGIANNPGPPITASPYNLTGVITYVSFTQFRIASTATGAYASGGTANISGLSYKVGDIYFQYNTSSQIIAQYSWNGTAWQSTPITNSVIANLDAGKITAGTITSIAYNNGSGTFSVSPSGVLVASSATITGAITATSGTFTGTVYASAGTFTGTMTSSNATITGGSLSVGGNFIVTSAGVLTATSANITGTITATSGSFTGSVFASAGTIGGFSLSATSIYSSTNLVIESTGNISGGNSQTLFYGFANIGGGSVTGERLIVAGTSALNGNTGVLGNLSVTNSCTFGAVTTQFEFLSSTGNVRVASTYGNAVSGRSMQISSSGLYGTTASTLRKKHGIESYKINLSALLGLDVKTFKYKSEIDPDQTVQYGFIAEDAEELGLNELIQYDSTGIPDYFAYEKLPIFLLQLAQEQDKRLKLLEGK